MFEVRRYKDIVAFREGTQLPLAFHARNMELAEVSEDVWQSMSSASLFNANSAELKSHNESTPTLKDWESSENPEATTLKLERGIRSLTINVTQICNLHCTYCAAGGDGTYGDAVQRISIEKTLPQIKFFIDQLKYGSHFHISFLGGEPLLYPGALKAIAEYTKTMAAEKEIQVSFKVTTNGTLLTPQNIELLNNIGTYVVVSLDGDAEINDRRRPDKAGRGSTEKILQGLSLLRSSESKIAGLEVHAVMDENHDDVEKTYEFFRHLPVDRFEFTYSVNSGNMQASQRFVESFARAAQTAVSLGGEKELRRFTMFDRYFNLLDNQLRVENHCGLGKTLAVIDARNRIFNCPWTVGDKNNQLGQGSILDYEKLAEYEANQIDRNECQNCWARFICGGGCSFVHASTSGNNLSKKEDFCYRSRYLIAIALKHYSNLRRQNEEEEEGELHEQKQTH